MSRHQPALPLLTIPAQTCQALHEAESLEWLATNGIGGYACGTVAGLNTRRYHGLLVAALAPPLGRTVMVSRLDELIQVDGRSPVELATYRWGDGAMHPRGHEHVEQFVLQGTVPTWRLAAQGVALEKSLWMEPGRNTTWVRYTALKTPSNTPVTLSVKALVNHRDYHALTHGPGWDMHRELYTDPNFSGAVVHAYYGARPIHVFSTDGQAQVELHHDWYERMWLAVETRRGQDDLEDVLHATTLRHTLSPGESWTLMLDADGGPWPQAENALARRQAHDVQLLQDAHAHHGLTDDRVLDRLTLSAADFVVQRPSESQPYGKTILAGYPWFSDWGRDTMIALPGLTLATGRTEIAANILRVFAEHEDGGMIPNRFPDVGDEPEYNTVDATLWYFRALAQYLDATDDLPLADTLWPTLERIINRHREGTRFQIQQDPNDGLLRAGEPGVQLTWMDAKFGDWVVTPRIGKPVEINALWLNALLVMADLAEQLGCPPSVVENYQLQADRVRHAFSRFWNPDTGCCFDVIDTPEGQDDPSVRPNQLLALSLPIDALSDTQAASLVNICHEKLYTPLGMRSLAPDHPDYCGRYEGAPMQRDGVYHQGTAWAWLLGPFIEAYWNTTGDRQASLSLLEPLEAHLNVFGLGSICEISDGDPPYTPRGCFAQAWSVAEALRLRARLINEP